MVQIQRVFSHPQGAALAIAEASTVHGFCLSFAEPHLASKALLALADDRLYWRADDALLKQYVGQLRQILGEDGLLQCNAGGRDDNGHFQFVRAVHLPKDTGHEVGQRFAGAYACFAQGNFFII